MNHSGSLALDVLSHQHNPEYAAHFHTLQLFAVVIMNALHPLRTSAWLLEIASGIVDGAKMATGMDMKGEKALASCRTETPSELDFLLLISSTNLRGQTSNNIGGQRIDIA